MRYIAIVAALSCSMGCSVIGVQHSPRPLPPRGPIPCTNGYGLPVFDAVLAMSMLVISGLVQEHSPTGEPSGFDISSGFDVASLGYTVSAVIGYGRVAHCRDDQRARSLDPDLAKVDPRP